jgi:penicillin-binding protein 1A
MLAAHEGVPIRPLPGGWKPAPVDAIVQDDGPAPTPAAPVANVGSKPAAPRTIAAQPVPAPSRPAGATTTVDAGGFDMPAEDNTPTASIRHPVPPGNVGGPLKKRNTTILDILTGG